MACIFHIPSKVGGVRGENGYKSRTKISPVQKYKCFEFNCLMTHDHLESSNPTTSHGTRRGLSVEAFIVEPPCFLHRS